MDFLILFDLIKLESKKELDPFYSLNSSYYSYADIDSDSFSDLIISKSLFFDSSCVS